jgi:beta-lactamase regulating signal transducer with metallopeptidase domain
MNALGILLAGSIAHATLFAIAAVVAYLAIRRSGPAAGSLAAGASLGIMALISIVVLSPWPRWWTFDVVKPSSTAAGIRDTVARDSALSAGPGDLDPTRLAPPRARIEPQSSVQPALLEVFLEELRRPADLRAAKAWGWRECLAVGFLASLALGAARLGLGLRGIAWLRTRSRPVEDRELEELVDVLRAELGCRRRVALREASELTTPATIGWWRPVVLLPFNWRDWDGDERRVVLAHELAHVRRRDFAAGVVAQVAVALHFYHPLAHWLAARLRLEQELAADAWGARLSGGQSSYLATLAQMALRRDGRALTWPARAFLPSRDTFVRRIEMLKNHEPIQRVTLPLFARVLTIAALAAVGLLVAGLRGPAGDSPALAQDREVEKLNPALADSHNLALLPAETRMVISVRPATLLARRDMRSLVQSLQHNTILPTLPVPPEDVEQLLVFWESTGLAEPPRGPAFVPPPSGIVLRMLKPQDWKALMQKLRGSRLEERRHDGQTYFHYGDDPWSLYAPDGRTLIVAEEVVLRDLIADRKAPPPRQTWSEAWNKVDKGQVMMALDTRWLRRRLNPAAGPVRPPGATLGFETFAPLYEKARSYAVSLNASDQQLSIDLVAAAASPEDAKSVTDTFQALLTLGKNALQGVRRDGGQPRGEHAEAFEWVRQALDAAVSQARIETSDGFVHLHSAPRVDLAEAIRTLAPAVSNARARARRAQSMNNLKQIGLAFHNYHSSNNRFPASVNREKAKFPYSWRVAILPYIEQPDLYNQYHFDEPWDGPNNIKLLNRMPATYTYPGSDGTPSSKTNTSYFIFTGRSTIGGTEGGTEIRQITDGTSNTILAVEAQRDIPWTKPEDIPFDGNAPLPVLGGFTPEGFDALFGDGSVRFLKKSINPMVLRALITKDGGEVISSDAY